ncbi:MAG: Na+/H+ antiporter NhaA [Mycobacteriaceae bacterium]
MTVPIGTGSVGKAARRRLFTRGSWAESSRVAGILRKETVGGVLLLISTVLALIWANSAWSDTYAQVSAWRVGPEFLHLHLSLAQWASDGLLAIFFFVVGLELKREFVAGDLRDPARAALPIFAAIGGMIVPATIFVLINASSDEGALQGWAIPTATDIAFALAVLAVIGTHLPVALRTFLLTLAVVDDLLAVTVIAIFYTSNLSLVPLLCALVPGGLFAYLVHRRVHPWWILVPLAVATWALVHASGIHATVAGVLLGFTVPVLSSPAGDDCHSSLAESFEHLLRPVSSGIAVPVFAFFAAGVTVGGWAGLKESFSDPVTLGVIFGLVVGKSLGVFGTTAIISRFTKATLDDGLGWFDIVGLSLLAGIGFTVSLLIGELAFGSGTVLDDHIKVGVLVGSAVAAFLAAVVLRLRNRVYRLICEEESRDADNDGIPDVYQRPFDAVT